ncbi:MAG: CPBP family intramembrane metalloprotease [Gemmatimonadetes bacterium]|nr:CPBP family intramembrane metalloprotease [Gemmatimonadota bacterium]
MARHAAHALALLVLLAASRPGSVRAQPDSAPAARRPPWGAEFRMPALSMVFPGIGQYMQSAGGTGLAFTGTAVAGFALVATVDTADLGESVFLPRTVEGQRAYFGLSLMSGAGELSAYDSFRRSLPALKRQNKYQFLGQPEPLGALFSAPFDPRFLGRWTTWLDLAYTGAVAALVVSVETGPGKRYQPYTFHDAAFGTAVSFQAGVGEEAMFRGWLYPLFHQATRQRFWLSNSIQAGIFGALHLPQAGPLALMIGGWGWYQGWLTRRNNWSIRESVFHHFWYDTAIFAVTFLTDERQPVMITFPTIRFTTPLP